MTCNSEAASVEAAHQKWGDQVSFVGVAWVGTDEAFQGFIDKHGLTFPQLSDDPGYVFSHFDVPAQPALVIIDAEGTAQTLIGAVDDATLDGILSDLTA